ncbi:MAG: T9SS type A sorting domain-containing protein [Bacteroidetes bacterium]|nr:T9SS type A sorting domain-containing protein [Bacteroidota bacterium]
MKTLKFSPFTDGSAVYQARALLTRYDSTEYINPCEYSTGQGSGNRFKEFNANSSINNDLAALNTLVYPNPATNILNISTEVEGATITIYNVTGQVVLSEKLTAITVLNIERLSNGTYLYKLTDANIQIFKTDKLIINK